MIKNNLFGKLCMNLVNWFQLKMMETEFGDSINEKSDFFLK